MAPSSKPPPPKPVPNTAGGSTFTWQHALRIDSTKSPFTSPVPQTHQAFKGVSPVSWKRYNIGGILTTIYGQDELPRHAREVACLWLLHGRGDTQDSMAYVAAGLLHAWNKQRKNESAKGLICVCFDQRNHGSRMVENLNNVSWKQGNPTHGQDMWSTYTGTAQDLSVLITHIASYLPYKIDQHITSGVSLGGHASWVVLMQDPRVRAGLIIVGCPDYTRLMTDRAIRSRVPSTLTTDPPGRDFLGSPDFPQSLLAAIEQYDPAGILLSELDVYGPDDHLHPPSEEELARLKPLLAKTLGGKNVMCLFGGKDRLVPYAQSKVFMEWLKRATDKESGWAKDLGIQLTNITDPNAGHEFSKAMREQSERWLIDYLSQEDERPIGRSNL